MKVMTKSRVIVSFSFSSCLLTTCLLTTCLLTTCLLTGAVTAQHVPGHDPIRVDTAALRDLAPEVGDAIHALATPQSENDSKTNRRKQIKHLLGVAAALPSLERVLDQKLGALEKRYAQILDEPIRAAYHKRLSSLSATDLRQVAMVRRVWRNYLLKPTGQLHFQQHFLVPATRVGKLLLPDVAAIRTKASKEQLRRMHEFNGYRDDVREELELDKDPTTGKKAPTGIPMPPLTKTRSYQQHIDHLHRSMAVASSAAPRGAQNILWDNADKARLIDLEEAEFILYANEIRMLMGSVAWATDILACAATRDHSKDRADGKASGHWSTLPGKKGFTHRLRRFGTQASSEGAGGGSNGRGYLHSLSYGGGHTGPLYALKRTRVGVGRYNNVYTSVYGKTGSHTSHATARTLFMPPGIDPEEIQDQSLIAVCEKLRTGDYGAAKELLRDAKAETKLDKFVRKYFKTVIKVEADWQLECLSHIAEVGDLRTVGLRIERAQKMFGESIDKGFKRYAKKVASKSGLRVRAAGEAYLTACLSNDRSRLQAVLAQYPGTVYAQAVQAHLEATKGDKGKGMEPQKWFLNADKYLARFEYTSK